MRIETVKKGSVFHVGDSCYTVTRVINPDTLECKKETFSAYSGKLVNEKIVTVDRSDLENRGYDVPVRCVFEVEKH